MKVQCPTCRKILSVPDEYEGEQIRCKACKKALVAQRLEETEIVPVRQSENADDKSSQQLSPHSESQSTQRIRHRVFLLGDFLSRGWRTCPSAFRIPFLGTLGVLSAAALFLFLHANYLRLFAPPPPATQKHPSSIAVREELAAVCLTDYRFSVYEKEPERWGFIWHAWVDNPLPYWAQGQYFVEFRNSNGSLLEAIGPIKATFPNTKEPREATRLHWMAANLAEQVDFEQSRIHIRLKE